MARSNHRNIISLVAKHMPSRTSRDARIKKKDILLYNFRTEELKEYTEIYSCLLYFDGCPMGTLELSK